VAFRFGYLHSFACSGADEIGFELGHHSEDVEQQPPNPVGRVVHGATDAELHALDRQFVDDVFRVPEGTGQSVKFGNDESVTIPTGGEGFAEAGAGPVSAGESVVRVDQVDRTPKASRALRWAVRSCSFVDTRAYPIMNSFMTQRVLLADSEVKNNAVNRPRRAHVSRRKSREFAAQRSRKPSPADRPRCGHRTRCRFSVAGLC
jgi:hypothetical protein